MSFLGTLVLSNTSVISSPLSSESHVAELLHLLSNASANLGRESSTVTLLRLWAWSLTWLVTTFHGLLSALSESSCRLEQVTFIEGSTLGPVFHSSTWEGSLLILPVEFFVHTELESGVEIFSVERSLFT